ncbi:MAG: hypothetical protein ACREEV_16385, partial [Dongiaceae bacterium]
MGQAFTAISTLTVMPAKAGIQGSLMGLLPWTPAFAGVTWKRSKNVPTTSDMQVAALFGVEVEE